MLVPVVFDPHLMGLNASYARTVLRSVRNRTGEMKNLGRRALNVTASFVEDPAMDLSR